MFWNNGIAPDIEPCKVVLKRGEWVDDNRRNEDGSARIVPYKIYVPVDHGQEKIPLVLWSHGFGGNRDGAGFISRYVAAHSYVVVHMTHTGTDSSLWEGKPGHPWDILRQTRVSRATTLNRFYDVPFVLDSLRHWATENSDTGALMDFNRIGMSGHSFGALSTQVAAGQLFLDADDRPVSLEESRIKAGILYSPVPVADHLLDKAVDLSRESVYAPISIPLLHMTGTEDFAPIGNAPYTHRLKVYEESGCPEKYLLIQQGADHMVYNGTRGKLERNPDRDRHEEIIKIMSLAFWEAQLKEDAAAQDWLRGSGVLEYLGPENAFRRGI